jgi:hypothetical protein
MAACIVLWGAILYCLAPGQIDRSVTFDQWWTADGQRLWALYVPPSGCNTDYQNARCF